jgi:hypothetical protein
MTTFWLIAQPKRMNMQIPHITGVGLQKFKRSRYRFKTMNYAFGPDHFHVKGEQAHIRTDINNDERLISQKNLLATHTHGVKIFSLYEKAHFSEC